MTYRKIRLLVVFFIFCNCKAVTAAEQCGEDWISCTWGKSAFFWRYPYAVKKSFAKRMTIVLLHKSSAKILNGINADWLCSSTTTRNVRRICLQVAERSSPGRASYIYYSSRQLHMLASVSLSILLKRSFNKMQNRQRDGRIGVHLRHGRRSRESVTHMTCVQVMSR